MFAWPCARPVFVLLIFYCLLTFAFVRSRARRVSRSPISGVCVRLPAVHSHLDLYRLVEANSRFFVGSSACGAYLLF